MNTTLVKGLHKLSINGSATPPSDSDPLSSSPAAKHNPSDNDYIKYLDYPALEANYNIHKYVPSYIHNGGIATPIIRDLIVDKPIYAAANSHVKKKKKKKGTSDGKTKKAERHEAHEAKKAERHEAHEAKKHYLEEKKALRQEHKAERRELKNNRYRGLGDIDISEPEEPYERDTFNFNSDLDGFSFNKSYGGDAVVFNNPYEPNYNNYTTRMDRRASSVTLTNSIPSAGPLYHKKRNNSIVSKLRHLVKGSSDEDSTPARVRSNRADDSMTTPPSEEDPPVYSKQDTNYFDNPLDRSNSFDQTKSTMTSSRKKNDGIKHKFMRLTFGGESKKHRAIGMYMDFFATFFRTKWGSNKVYALRETSNAKVSTGRLMESGGDDANRNWVGFNLVKHMGLVPFEFQGICRLKQ
ncbi:uncharacterized protein CANTADRAFT_5503 [Suhomyces tanzawaensis NRRL Y-17324]|uniref:Uncharacterized protein n=1 Tax=Suhomyces tanzawaensis NRRL Y-17324 TaxID=984487 RepID=A0A1E4SJV5_9ASCO|nr:uncharacterized protein CANTADRAFT_5503 [Suhomyces tanzawaensis NRRL Y-17324]ODV79795.1 hypothetical protein CANTADRAFT_5503 [Suhomyces tanzawaensis NRRL Y-17324]